MRTKAVVSDQRRMRMMSVKIEGADGSPALSGTSKNAMSVADSDTGDYLLSFNVPFKRAPEVLVTSGTDDTICRLGTVGVGSAQILIEDLSGSAADGDVHVVVLGSDDPDVI